MSFNAIVRLPPASGRRLAGIEGLRAIAATTILVCHAWFYSNPDGGPLWDGEAGSIPFESMAFGVTLFFALSGFLLYRPFLVAAFEPDRRPSVSAYFRNRALRILPAYWVILLIVSLVLQSALVREGADLHTGALTNRATCSRPPSSPGLPPVDDDHRHRTRPGRLQSRSSSTWRCPCSPGWHCPSPAGHGVAAASSWPRSPRRP